MRRLTSSVRMVAVAACLLAALALPTPAHEGLHEQIAEVTAQIKRDPKNASLYLKRGELNRLHRDWTAAFADYSRAEQLNPRLDEVKFGRGRTYFEADKPRQARIWLDRFLIAKPSHVDALVTRARVLVKLNQHLAATADYSRAIAQLEKPKPEYYIERAQAFVAIGRTDEALVGIDEGVKRLGPIVTLQLFAIDLELSSKRYDSALSRLELISAQSPRKESWLARRGDILLVAGREDEARKAFTAALAAIEALPPNHRATKATFELERRVRGALGATR
jgi:tetratricopeptide (TPR) repeat protein